MKTHPEFTCSACGSANLRRSQSTSVLDIPKMALGIYPFRCLDCRERFWINIWLFSKRKQAMCPRCLLLDVIPYDARKMRLGLWKRLLLKAGARGYRCSVCRHRFLSFRHGVRSTAAPRSNEHAPKQVAQTASVGE